MFGKTLENLMQMVTTLVQQTTLIYRLNYQYLSLIIPLNSSHNQARQEGKLTIVKLPTLTQSQLTT